MSIMLAYVALCSSERLFSSAVVRLLFIIRRLRTVQRILPVLLLLVYAVVVGVTVAA